MYIYNDLVDDAKIEIKRTIVCMLIPLIINLYCIVALACQGINLYVIITLVINLLLIINGFVHVYHVIHENETAYFMIKIGISQCTNNGDLLHEHVDETGPGFLIFLTLHIISTILCFVIGYDVIMKNYLALRLIISYIVLYGGIFVGMLILALLKAFSSCNQAISEFNLVIEQRHNVVLYGSVGTTPVS
jgi:hypothetical protein